MQTHQLQQTPPQKRQNSLVKVAGTRKTFSEHLQDVCIALGTVVLLNGTIDTFLVLIAFAISLLIPGFAGLKLTGFDLPVLFNYFLSTFSLMLGTSISLLLIFKVRQGRYTNGPAFLCLIVIIYLGALCLSATLGMFSASPGFLASPPSPPPFAISDFDLRHYREAVIAFYVNKFGVYKFLESTVAAIVIAQIIHFKILPYLKKWQEKP